jgi:hypothetical protein
MIKIEEIENFFDNWERKNVDYKDEQYCFKYAEDTQLAYIAGFKKCRAMLKHIIHEMEQDSLYPKPVNKEVFKVLQRHVKKLKSI